VRHARDLAAAEVSMGGAKRILIVDDDESFAESNRDLLEAYGCEVVTAKNGTDGLALAKQIRPDLMILDVMMTTETEGFEVARKNPRSA